MRLAPRHRCVALLVALLGSLAAPATAMTHGWVHHQAAHGHAQESGLAEAARERDSHGPEATPAEDHHAHGHGLVEVAPCVREGHRLPVPTFSEAVLPRVDVLCEVPYAVRPYAITNHALLARPDPGGTEPPSLRAPPVG